MQPNGTILVIVVKGRFFVVKSEFSAASRFSPRKIGQNQKSPAASDETLLREHYMKMKKINPLIRRPNYNSSSLSTIYCCQRP